MSSLADQLKKIQFAEKTERKKVPSLLYSSDHASTLDLATVRAFTC